MTLAATPAWAPTMAAPTSAPPAARLADALVVPFAAFDHRQDTTPKAKRMRWPTLAAWLQRYDERQRKDGPGWSPAVYKEGATRANEGVEALSAAVLDVDHVEPDWTLLEGYEYVAYQTFSHTPQDPRWRIVLPFAEQQPAAGWGETWARIRAALCPDADPACKDAARLHYLPSCPPGDTRRAIHHRGHLLDPTELPPLPQPPAGPPPRAHEARGAAGTRPGDDFNARGDLAPLLTRHGWRWVYDRGEEGYWRRPGKREGISATTNYAGTGLFYVFTSSAPPFDPATAYTKFHAYALLEHRGDFSAAARALAAEGYGERELEVDLGNRTNGHAAAYEINELNEVSTATGGELGVNSFNSYPKTWPKPLAAEAFHGLAGDVVALFTPHTEADQAAVLVQFLAAFANAVGPAPHVMVGPTRHGARLSVAVVGDTSRARKGDSWQCVREVFRRADSEWLDKSVSTGLSTGEGLISAVKDASIDASTGAATEAADRRVLAVETEFGRTLRAMAREGNTLSAVLRDAWDGRDLAVMTRGTPLRATGAHISTIGHVTIPELRRELSATDAHNGFANRFLWVCAKRSQFLADPTAVPPDALAEVAARVTAALGKARGQAALMRDEETRAVWQTLYPLLTEDREGLAGDVLARSESQVLRLSMVYALLDGSPLIRFEHLAAAIAVWDYCAASVVHIFGAASGDTVADDILRFLSLGGEQSRTDISTHLGRNVRSGRIAQALEALKESGRATSRIDTETAGRPAELWRATGKPSQALVPLLPALTKETKLTKKGVA